MHFEFYLIYLCICDKVASKSSLANVQNEEKDIDQMGETDILLFGTLFLVLHQVHVVIILALTPRVVFM